MSVIFYKQDNNRDREGAGKRDGGLCVLLVTNVHE